MLGIYGNTWSSQFGLSPIRNGELTQAGKAWLESITGLTWKRVAGGITAAQRSGNEYPPNAARFRVLALGLPNLSEVEAELLPGRDRSAFSVLVWSKLDTYRYRTAEGREQRRILGVAFDLALRHVQEGGALPEPTKALGYEPHRAPTVSDRDRARAAMLRAAGEIDGVLGGAFSEQAAQ